MRNRAFDKIRYAPLARGEQSHHGLAPWLKSQTMKWLVSSSHLKSPQGLAKNLSAKQFYNSVPL